MTTTFSIETKWLGPESGKTPDSSELSIWVNGLCATEVEDLLDDKSRPAVRLSALKLAEWLAGSWWRLRWEPDMPAHADEDAVSDWNLSHNMACSGSGYVWPDITFSSDGDSILVSAKAAEAGRAEPIQYKNGFAKTIAGAVFENGVDQFVHEVITLLGNADPIETDLPDLWAEVLNERKKPELTDLRRLEASLGYDPAEAPGDLIESLQEQGVKFGAQAVQELAAYFKADVLNNIDTLNQEIDSLGVAVTVPESEVFRQGFRDICRDPWISWERGERAARLARQVWQIRPGPVSDSTLSNLFGKAVLTKQNRGRFPLSTGIRGERERQLGGFRASLKPASRTGRRFALSRLVADYLTTAEEDTLLPITNSKTSRQKFQRAFAREFLCPFTELQDNIGNGTPSHDDILDMADYFRVSEWVIGYSLVNKGVLDHDTLVQLGI